VDKSDYAQYSSVGEMLLDMGLINNIHNGKRIKEIKEWLKACNEKPNSPWRNYETQAEAFPEETTAEYLTFKTGKQWNTDDAHGYCQGDYVKMVYCSSKRGDSAARRENAGKSEASFSPAFRPFEKEGGREPKI